MENSMYHLLFKTIVVGDSGVGKSCLVTRFQEDRFDHNCESTLGVEFGSHTLVINKLKLKMALWDTAGQERFHSISRSYYRGSACVVLVYDVTRRSTFLSISKWLQDARTHCSEDGLQVIYVLLGNKIDMNDKREVMQEEGLHFAMENGITMFVEASAMTGELVHEMFKDCASAVLEKVFQRKIHVSAANDDVCSSGVRAGSLGANLVTDLTSPSPHVSIEKHKQRIKQNSGCCS